MTHRPMSIVMEEVTDLEELAQARRRHAQFERNLAWFQTHAAATYAAHRGQHICIGGMAVFRGQCAALTDPEALDMSVLGRDISNVFAVVVDRPRDVICLLGQQHRYVITQQSCLTCP